MASLTISRRLGQCGAGRAAGAICHRRARLFAHPAAARQRLDAMAVLDHCARHERPLYLSAAFAGRLFASDTRWLRPSFLLFETMDARPAGQGRAITHGFEPMDLKLYDTLTREKRVFSPLDPAQRAHVCVRADGLRLRPYRQRAAGDRVRRAVPPAAPHLRRRPRHLCAQHHRRRRQDQCARGGGISRPAAQRGDPQGHGKDRPAIPRGRRRARLPAADRRAARDRAHRRDAHADRAAGRSPATPMSPTTTCCSACPRCRITAGCRSGRSTR